MNYIKILSISVLGLLVQSCTQDTNWNQYLGPNRDATIRADQLLNNWGETGPKKLWSFPLGEGYGGASIYDDEVYVLDRIKGESDILRCIDLNSGEEIWNYTYEAPGEISYPGSRAVPTVDKRFIWSVGPKGDVYCFDKKSRKPVWNFNMKEKYNAGIPFFGSSQSPLLYHDQLIISLASDKAGLASYRKASGELVWESRPFTGNATHVSPMLATFGGVDQVIIISPYDRKDSTKVNEIVSFDARNGKELWKYEGLQSHATLAAPVLISENRLFITDCSYNGNFDPVSILLEIHKEGDKFLVKELFKTEDAGCKMHPGVFYNEHIFLNNNGKPSSMQCLDLSGKAVWESDSIPAFDLGGLILINDLIIIQNGKNGDIHLVEANPQEYKELGKASFFNSKKSQAWAPPAFSKGKLIVRDLEQMVCVDLTRLE